MSFFFCRKDGGEDSRGGCLVGSWKLLGGLVGCGSKARADVENVVTADKYLAELSSEGTVNPFF